MRCNEVKATICGKGFRFDVWIATDSIKPLDVINHVIRALQANGFDRVHWESIHFHPNALSTDDVVYAMNLTEE